jgi:surfeit locus 1 family protein
MQPFRPTGLNVALIPLAILMAALGWWQLERMKSRQLALDQFSNPKEMTLEQALEAGKPFTRVETVVRFDPVRHILLDNQVLNGRPGVHVLTPFTTESGTTILVNRGWQAIAPDRRSLPEFETPREAQELQGILAPPPEHRQRLGAPDTLQADQWPQLVTYLDIDAVAAVLKTALPVSVVWLATEHPAGFEGRDWKPAVMTPQRHQAYALQWFALSAAALIGAVLLGVRRRSNQDGDRAP